ncbi:MAG TPA: hypothetical protein DIU37_05120 [Opitutae bacterium]|uniref:Uncharacterized protein n=1 Tax=Alteromonas australica TaxID=589873 RepID=A0A358DZZ4_9ALTE|nr:hypothetical protein [Alteromonas australica]MBU32596.1 hypothetical protein [Alteromonas sp.]HBU51493.1 hypothetical protein [Alteromonas australica]HCR37512.1 hypothetical protein [Opitutae bacterium]|tara:strand:- start:24963 stop:25295 length:333 start_codon:yes stop_codon:yes gene_type:complete
MSRVSKQIKLTDVEVVQVQALVEDSNSPSQKAYLDEVISDFLDDNKLLTQVEFLSPSRSGQYRTIWIGQAIVKAIKEFAHVCDASENAVIFTAVKRRLLLQDSEQGAINA